MENLTRYTVYETTNLINGKTYIGKHVTLNPEDDYLGSGTALKRAVQKYGKENFRKEILYIFDSKEEMNSKEIELVSLEFCREKTNYNLAPGGAGGFGFINDCGLQGYKLYPENAKANRAKSNRTCIEKYGEDWRRERRKLYVCSDETRDKLKELRKNRFSVVEKHSEETKSKMSASKKITSKGERNSQFGSMWITDGISNKKIKKIDPIPDLWYKGRSHGDGSGISLLS